MCDLFQSRVLDSFPKKWPRTWLRLWSDLCFVYVYATHPFVRFMVLQTKTNYSAETYTRRRKNGWMSSIRPHKIRDTDCESPFLKFFEGRDGGSQRIADNSIDLISKFTSFYLLVWRPTVSMHSFVVVVPRCQVSVGARRSWGGNMLVVVPPAFHQILWW